MELSNLANDEEHNGMKVAVVFASLISSALLTSFLASLQYPDGFLIWVFVVGFFLYPIIGALCYLPIGSLWSQAFPSEFKSPRQETSQGKKLYFITFWPLATASGLALCPAIILINALTKIR